MSLGSFLSGVADGGMAMQRHRFDRDLMDAMKSSNAPAPSPTGGGDYGDPIDTSIPAHGRAFLNAVAAGESGGKYDVRFTPSGGASFDVAGGHPRIYEKGPHGPSSAAGRYQFTAQTWDDYGGGADFSPARQDQMAWHLGQDRYRRVTGRDLSVDLQERGFTSEMAAHLAPTWVSFEGAGADKAIGAYRSSMDRYGSAQPEPRSLPGSEPKRTLMSRILEGRGLFG